MESCGIGRACSEYVGCSADRVGLRSARSQARAPLAGGQPGERQAADADAAQGPQFQSGGVAGVLDEARRGRLERETQPGFVLPADLHRRGRQAVVRQAPAQPGESFRVQAAADLGNVFLFDQTGFFLQLACHRIFLRVDHQATGGALQRRHQSQSGQQALEVALRRAVALHAVGGHDQVAGRARFVVGIHAHGFVDQDGHRPQRLQARAGQQADGLARADPETGLLDHLPVHRDPAAFDIAFGVGARARLLDRDALGQAFSAIRHLVVGAHRCGLAVRKSMEWALKRVAAGAKPCAVNEAQVGRRSAGEGIMD